MQWSSQLEILLPFDISFEISEICCQIKHLNWMLIYEQEEKKKGTLIQMDMLQSMT